MYDADSGLFDASHYAFFGKDIVDEVELGGLEEEESSPAIGGGFGGEDELHEYHLFDKDEVNHMIFRLFNLVLAENNPRMLAISSNLC